MIKIGINGFGRIGRCILRIAVERGHEISAINDMFLDASHMGYLLKYDSSIGRFPGIVKSTGDHLIVNHQIIRAFREEDPIKIPWGESKAEYIAECTGQFSTVKLSTPHISNGAKKVLITAYSHDAPPFIVGCNLQAYKTEFNIISCSSCTANAIGPVVMLLKKHFGIAEGVATAIHAVTSKQNVLDSHHPYSRILGRSCMQNIIPAVSVGAKGSAQIMPDLKGKLRGSTLFVPVGNVSVVDLSLHLEKPAKFNEIKEILREASEGPLKNILGYTGDDVVSIDFNTDVRSSIFDSLASYALNDHFVKLVLFYDNELGFACRIIDTIEYMYKIDRGM